MSRQASWVLLVVALITSAVRGYGQTNTFPASGNVGIGTTTPAALLQVNGAAILGGSSISGTTAGKSIYLLGEYNDGSRWQNASVGGAVAYNGGNYLVGTDGGSNGGWLIQGEGSGDTLIFYTIPSSGGTTQTISPSNFGQYARMTIENTGNVGIGTVQPSAALEVNGSVKLTSGSGASVTFADGTVQSTAYTGVICGGDYAESVDVSGDRKHYEPGDVLVISSDEKGDVAKSSKPYSTAVVGIYSTKPGIIGRRQTGSKDSEEVPMAMIGIVPTKVTTENGAIHRGDLLVSSSLIGHAMKGTDHSRLTGAVIGKALGNLDKGEGVIEVVVTLQ